MEAGNKWWRAWNGVPEPPTVFDVEEPENPYQDHYHRADAWKARQATKPKDGAKGAKAGDL